MIFNYMYTYIYIRKCTCIAFFIAGLVSVMKKPWSNKEMAERP